MHSLSHIFTLTETKMTPMMERSQFKYVEKPLIDNCKMIKSESIAKLFEMIKSDSVVLVYIHIYFIYLTFCSSENMHFHGGGRFIS